MVNVWDDVRMDASSAHAAARERFEADLGWVQSEASELVAGLRAAASQIDGALQDAYAEQRRRERRREDIREQRRREAQVR